ncbi:MAG: hypothetical protein AAGA90_05555 [Actinomycetota bacterium]
MTRDPEQVLDGVLDRTLPKPEWTHEAHVAACWAAVREHGADGALTLLRAGIKRYNEATGVANTPTSGYHETITRYYVGAVARVADRPFADVVDDPTIGREGPLAHWSRDVLFTRDARAAWVEPDLAALPAD